MIVHIVSRPHWPYTGHGECKHEQTVECIDWWLFNLKEMHQHTSHSPTTLLSPQGQRQTISCFIRAPILVLGEVHMCHVTANANASERRVNTSVCFCIRGTVSLPCGPGLRCGGTLMPSSALNAGQEAGRLDNYRDPHPIQMSIKLFRAWHDPPLLLLPLLLPLTGREDNWRERKE